jgi:hypothetical protein
VETYVADVGPYRGAFTLHFLPDHEVEGSYYLSTKPNLIMRLKGIERDGELKLDERTHDKLTSHITLSQTTGEKGARWIGKMRNTFPDNKVFDVSLLRTQTAGAGGSTTQPAISIGTPSPKTGATDSGSGAAQDYKGTVGPYTGYFTLQIQANGQVRGSYYLNTNTKLVLQLKGTSPGGELHLEEFTRGNLSAHITLTRTTTGSEVR